VESAARILVVDDEPVEMALIQMTLEKAGHAVVALTSPKEAVERVAVNDFDLVLTDLMMPELSGLEVCERVLGARSDMRVIVVTGHGSMETAIEAMRVGAYDFLTKPIEPDALNLVVARAVKERRVSTEVRRLERGIDNGSASSVFGTNAAMRSVQDLIARIATSSATVLISGETGTGKERVARALHEASGRPGAFVALNCAAVPANLLESELFGHARGAYTDAHSKRDGLFVEADGGTIFLDEIADMPLDIQPKLLRAIQERKVRPIGANAEVEFDARLVTATNRNLEDDIAEKRFRKDLYYRINVINVDLPPLRQRGDVIELATYFLAQLAKRTGRPCLRLGHAAAQKLLEYGWPGNVRELENCMERAVVIARFEEITVEDLPEKVQAYRANHVVISDHATEVLSMDEVERRYVIRVLALANGNKARAARMLGFDRRTLYRKLVQFGVALDEFKGDPEPRT
jgi:DNA-binding NtrC family response regulator